MVRAASDGMRIQVVTLGAVLAGFGLASHWVIPRVFGPEWMTVTALYPFVAIGYLTSGLFQPEAAMLNVVSLSRRVGEFHLMFLVLFVAAALILVPRIGPLAYGWSEIAALPSYGLLHWYTRRLIGKTDWQLAGLWWLAFVSLLLWQQLGWLSIAVPVAVSVWPPTVEEFRKYLVSVRQIRYAE